MAASVSVKGLSQMLRKTKDLKFSVVEESKKVINKYALKIRTGAITRLTAKKGIDTGRLRSSIRTEFAEDGLVGKIGTNAEHGPYIEFGTGLLNDPPPGQPKGSGKRHFPKPEALVDWVRRHRASLKRNQKNKAKAAKAASSKPASSSGASDRGPVTIQKATPGKGLRLPRKQSTIRGKGFSARRRR